MRISDWSSDVCSSDLTLLISGIAASAELALYAFLGVLVDWMTVSTPERFLAEHGWALAGMAFVALALRPVATLVSRGLLNLGLAPGLTNPGGRKSVVCGKSVTVRVDLGGRSHLQNKTNKRTNTDGKTEKAE